MNDFVLTKIIATLGPAAADQGTIIRLIEAGTRVCRINFSHGTWDEFTSFIRAVRAAEEHTGRAIGVLGDLCGPKFRLGQLEEGQVILRKDERVEFIGPAEPLHALPTERANRRFTVNQPSFLPEIRQDDRILINDGALLLVCTEAASDRTAPVVRCRVEIGGPVSSGKGINLPDTDLSQPALTDWDWQCVEFAVQEGFDFLALSFVRNQSDVRQLKDRLRDLGARPRQPKKSEAGGGPKYSSYGGGSRAFIPVVAKIEKPQALVDLEGIIEEADAVMVARGDLGVEMDLAQVPVIQKRIIRVCHEFGKPVIVATQMLQSLIESPVPTRAEVSDVANAIFDGADAVMLSGETAIGRHPEEAVRMMRRIAKHTNDHQLKEKEIPSHPVKLRQSKYRTAALARGVNVIVRDLEAKFVVMWSQLGGGASYLAQNKLPVPVIACSSNPEALRRMSLLYGIIPRHMQQPQSVAQFITDVDALLLTNRWVDCGDPVVLVLGEPIGQAGLTNKVRVHYVGDVV